MKRSKACGGFNSKQSQRKKKQNENANVPRLRTGRGTLAPAQISAPVMK
jgi:hypothetical protein